MVAVAPVTAQQSRPALQSELMAALHARWAALARHDTQSYGRLLDDAILIPDNGDLYDKKALIARAGDLGESSTEPRDVHVSGHGDSAVMLYRTTSHVPFDGQEITEELTIVETYVKRDGRWLLAARAESEIPHRNRVPATVAPAVLDAYTGDYEIRPGKIIHITREGGHLMEQGPDDPKPAADWPLADNAFFQRAQPGIVTFTRSPQGKVESYVLWIYDSTIVARKIR